MLQDPLLSAILLGAIQGLTEFLPVSSTGHIFLFETYMGLVPDENLVLWLHIGSLLAVIVYFRDAIWDLIAGLYRMAIEKKSNDDGIYALQLIVATVCFAPTALITRALFPYSELTLSMVGVTLLITAALIYIAEKTTKSERPLSWKVIIALGLVQGLAVLPGISRSGLTIAFLIYLGINRQLSAKTSFLLSIPTIIASAVYVYFEQGEIFYKLGYFEIASVIASALFAYVAIVWMMSLIRGRWIYFAPYCAALGSLVIILSLF